MIDEFSPDRTGWARFSDDRRFRYRLSRMLRPIAAPMNDDAKAEINRVVFLMLNPSTADAFKLDPTVKRCVKFAQRWGAHVLEVVNLFALRSPKPRDVVKAGAPCSRARRSRIAVGSSICSSPPAASSSTAHA